MGRLLLLVSLPATLRRTFSFAGANRYLHKYLNSLRSVCHIIRVINIYDRERLLIELIRKKKQIPFDYYKEVLLNYRKILPQLDIQAIQDYAMEAPKSNKIMETLQMEVM